MRTLRLASTALALVASSACAPRASVESAPSASGAAYDVVIENGRVIDGTGSAWFYGDVALRGDRIAAIAPRGAFRTARATQRVDATGHVVSPGFIDIQAHSIGHYMLGDGKAISMVTQGITTAIHGEGSSLGPMNDKLLAAEGDTAVRRVLSQFVGPHGFAKWLEYMVGRGASQQSRQVPAQPGGRMNLQTGVIVIHSGRGLTVKSVDALRTRTDTWVLARVVQDGDRLLIEQIPCAMEIKPVAGVRVGMTEAAVRALPSASFVLQAEGEAWTGLPWSSGWGEEDLDQDGEPGVSVQVRSPLCGGELAVASQTLSTAQARFDGQDLSGSLQVEVQQRILGAHGACLRAVAQDSVDRMQGTFRYAPAPPGARCEDLPRTAWPIAD